MMAEKRLHLNKRPPKATHHPAQEALKRPQPVNPLTRETLFQNDIDHQFQADELKMLTAGGDDFYTLYRDDMTGRPRGVALLVPDWSQHAASSRGLDYLREKLPEYGWVTYSMTVPVSKEQVYTTATQGSASQPVDTSKPPGRIEPLRLVDEAYMEQYELQMQMRMQALIEQAQNHQGYFIVIAQGSSAAVLASLYAKEALEEPQAMILLSAAMPDLALYKKLNQDITINPIPTLDIYQSRDGRWIKQNVKKRKQLARKNFKAVYRQKELYGDISYLNQNHRLFRQIYGWLSHLGL